MSSKKTRLRFKRFLEGRFHEIFKVDLVPTDSGDRQVSVTHKPTGLTEYGLMQLGATEDQRAELVDRMMEDLAERVVKAGGVFL